MRKFVIDWLSEMAEPHQVARNLVLFGLLHLMVLSVAAGETEWVTGNTEPIKDVTMSSPVAGIIGARPFVEGAQVKAGQVVVELDKRIEELEVERRKQVRDLAEKELQRMKSLAEKNAISVSREEIEKRQAEYNVAQVELDLANEQLHRRLILSPIDGHIVKILLEVGEGCEAQQPVIRIVDTSRCYFVVDLEYRLGARLKTNQKVDLEIESEASTVAIKAQISYVAPVVDPASGLLRVKAVFDNPDGKIRPGVSGKMALP
jgi:RND family efflux transporter MFP subunit